MTSHQATTPRRGGRPPPAHSHQRYRDLYPAVYFTDRAGFLHSPHGSRLTRRRDRKRLGPRGAVLAPVHHRGPAGGVSRPRGQRGRLVPRDGGRPPPERRRCPTGRASTGRSIDRRPPVSRISRTPAPRRRRPPDASRTPRDLHSGPDRDDARDVSVGPSHGDDLMHADDALTHDEPIRSNCPYCGAEVVGRNRMCLVHLVADPDWAAANRAMCDLVHRGRAIEAPRRGAGGPPATESGAPAAGPRALERAAVDLDT